VRRGRPVVARWFTPADIRRVQASVPVTNVWIAEMTGVRPDTVTRWLNGTDPIPTRVPGQIAAGLRGVAAAATSEADALDTAARDHAGPVTG